MVLFFKTPEQQIIAVDVMHELSAREVEKLSWLFGRRSCLPRPVSTVGLSVPVKR